MRGDKSGSRDQREAVAVVWERNDKGLARVLEGWREGQRDCRSWCLNVGLRLGFDWLA